MKAISSLLVSIAAGAKSPARQVVDVAHWWRATARMIAGRGSVLSRSETLYTRMVARCRCSAIGVVVAIRAVLPLRHEYHGKYRD